MIIDCIADLHGDYPVLEGGDLLIVAGDLTARDTENEYALFDYWMNEQNYKKKIVISGNHDNYLNDCRKVAVKPLFHGLQFCEYLCDSGTEFEGLKIWGTPWTKTFHGMNPNCKAFTCDTEGELFEKFSLIPNDIDILVTHSPPYLIGDLVHRYRVEPEHVGSRSLGKKLKDSSIKLHVFGHIHSGYGETRLQREKDDNEFIFVNASIMNEDYDAVNKPIRIIL
jgi:Icc-related predicted phosphoesterase